ncbi:class A beta-lactamase [Roseibium suaedae]|uniref:Beta-lactamase n=1 Tax=Roseibium suaedae TaxID=735517 RepID=A0A1M7P9E4_9HYPH|nr:class A beta-lactamase [Roseibium suaedae]SHN13073.1 beta-lactamase class A/beta-lactamase class A SHV [Roseibium suaedae]
MTFKRPLTALAALAALAGAYSLSGASSGTGLFGASGLDPVAPAFAGTAKTETQAPTAAIDTVIARREEELGARIGVQVREREGGFNYAHAADDRFPMASTFKALLCGAVLARVDAGEEDLSRRITYKAADLVAYSPATEKHVKDGMTIGKLCEAAVTLSDNTAANLLLESVGGPQGLTAFLRWSGDSTTRLDRTEPDLNEALPGDPRDTTTPAAMSETIDRLVFGDVLMTRSRAQLRQWMIEDKVADALIRSKLPKGWTIGDKTGAGARGTRGITAFLIAPDGRTFLATIYLTENEADLKQRNQVIADISEAIFGVIAEK